MSNYYIDEKNVIITFTVHCTNDYFFHHLNLTNASHTYVNKIFLPFDLDKIKLFSLFSSIPQYTTTFSAVHFLLIIL